MLCRSCYSGSYTCEEVENVAANVTCQTASTFSVPPSPLQYEVLVILLGDPQFEGIFQQNFFRFEPHVSTRHEVISLIHLTCHGYLCCGPTANPWTFVCARIPPFPTSTRNTARAARHSGIVVSEKRRRSYKRDSWGPAFREWIPTKTNKQ